MCNPAAFALTQDVAGAGANFLGGIIASRAQRQALASQARITDINAGMLDDLAGQALYDGSVMASRRKMAGQISRSARVARMAAGNVVVGEGSSGAVLASEDYATAVDAAQIEANAIRGALGLRTEARNLRNEAAGLRVARAGISPAAQGLSSFLTAAQSVSGKFTSLKDAGGFKVKTGPRRA